MKKLILALVLCVTLCLAACLATADGTAMTMPDWRQVNMPRVIEQGETVNVVTPVGQNIGAIKMTIKDTNGWGIKLTEVKNVSEADNGKLTFIFGTVAQSGFQVGHQYLVELMAIPKKANSNEPNTDDPTSWEGYWSRVLTVVPAGSPAGLQVYISGQEDPLTTNGYTVETGYYGIYITAYDPSAQNVWIVLDGEAIQGYDGNSMSFCAGYDEPGTHTVYAVSVDVNGNQTVSQEYTIIAEDIGEPALYTADDLTNLIPVSYFEGNVEKSLEAFPNTITAGTDISYTVHYVRRTDLGLDAAGLEQQVWYDSWLDDLTDWEGNRELPCYKKRQEPEVPYGPLMNAETGDQTITIDHSDLQVGHTYRLSVEIRSAGRTPVRVEKTFTVLPAQMDSQHTISLSFRGDAANQTSIEVPVYGTFQLHASAPDATVVRFWNGDGFEYLNHWIGGDWTGGFDFEWSSWGSGERQFYIQAYYGELSETPWDQMDWDPACISNILTVNTPEGNASDRIAPEYTTYPTGHTITQGEYYTVTLMNAGMLNQAGAYVGADVNNGNDIWNHYDAEGDQIMIPTADLEEGYYTLTVYTEIPGAGRAESHVFFRVLPATYPDPDNKFLITTTATAAEGIYTVESYEDFGVTFYAPDMEGYRKYYRFFGGNDWWWDEWMDRSVTLNLELDPGEYEIYAEVVYVPDDEDENEIRFESEHLQFVSTSAGSSGIALDAPGSYVITENSTGYTASIVFPAGFDASRAADEYWELVLQTTHGPDIMRFSGNNGDNPQLPLTFPAELFEAGETYRLWLHMDVRGYDHVHEEICFAATEEPAADQPTLSLTVNGEVGDVDVLAHDSIRVKVEKDDSISAVRVLNGDHWEVWWGGDSFRRDWGFGRGTYGLVAQGTTEEPFWDEENFDWEGFDWNEDVNWNVTSNVVTIKVTTPNGQLDSPTLTLNKDTYTRGETITATVGKADGSEWYNVHICPSNDDGYPDGNWVYDAQADSTGTGTLTFSIPTTHIEPGRYAIWVDNNAVGYDGNGSGWKNFTVMEPEGYTPQAVLEIPEEISTNQNIEIYAYVPGADDIWLEIRKAGDDGWWNDRNRGGNYAIWEFGEAYRGTYLFTLYGHVEGETVQAVGPVTLEVQAEYDLEDATVEVTPDVLTLGSNNGITGSFTKTDDAEWYQVRLVYRGPTGNWGDEELENDFRDGEDIGTTFEYGSGYFTKAGVYEVQVFGGATGYNGTDNRRRILVIDAPAESDEYLTLTVNGSGDAYQDYLSSQNMKVKVGYQTRPTAVRILNGDFWEYWWGEGENFQRDWGFGDGETFMYAEATWEEINFDTFTESDWDEFNWDEDLNWCGRSNIIVLNISSPYGEMTAPTYTLNTENGQLAWGEDLVITIADEGPTGPDAEVLEDGWFFFNLDVERWNEYGPWWDRVSNNFNFQVRSGVNRIPTYMLEGGCRYRIEIGADGEGYGGRSTWTEFTLGEKPETQNEIKYFRVNGSAAEEISVQTHEELQLAAYYSNAEWYGVEITREDDEGWQDYRNDCRSGMLMDWWRSDSAGTYTLTAYGYGNLPEGQTNEYGDNFWREEIGAVTVTVTADHGDLGELTAEMPDRAYAGDPIDLTFSQIEDEPDGTLYSYWIHRDQDNEWITGQTRRGAGTVTIDTSRLEPDVYWVELDAMAAGYNQSHATLHMALLDPDDTDLSSKDMGYYFTTSMQQPLTTEGEDEPETDFVVRAGEDFRFTFYMPGAENVNLSQKKSDWQDSNGFAGCDGPGISQWHSFDSRGVYTIYGSYQADGRWSDEIELCTVTVTAEGSLRMPWVEMPMVVNAGEDVLITYYLDENINSYSYWISFENDGWNICGDWKNADDLRGDEISEDNSFDFVIPADKLEANRVYHVYLDVNTPGWEQGHEDRLLYVLGEADEDAVMLTVNDRNGQAPQAIAIGDRYPVTVSAPGAETLHVWWDESVSYIDLFGDYFEQEFCLDWRGGEWAPDFCTFYAIATYDGSWLKVSPTIELPISNRDTAEEAEAPTLSLANDGPICRGQFLLANVGEVQDEGVYEYNAYITDEYGNWIYRNDREDAGVIALPTNDLEPGQTYRLSAYARVMGKYRTDSPAIEFTVSEPTANLFVTNKTTVAVMEKMIVSIAAPGANRVRFNSGYGNWEEFDGDSWYGDWISWNMSEDDITIEAEALFPGDDDWTPIGGIPITITADGSLDQPQFNDLPDIIAEGEDLNISVSEVDGAEEYEIQLNRFDGQDGLNYRSGSPNFHIPAGRLYGGGYRIEIWAMAYGKNAGRNETSLYVERFRPEIGIDSVVSNTENLDITVPVAEDGDDYHLMIHYVPNDNFEESILYRESLGAGDADENGVLHFTVPAGLLRDNTTHWADLWINGENFYAENSKAFLVKNGQTDGNITVTVNGESDEAYVMIHDNFRVSVNAPGAKAIIVHCGDLWQAHAGSTVTDAEFNEHQICRETLYAQAYYGNETDLPWDPWDNRWLDLEWDLPSHTVDVNFYAIGQAGEPWGRFPNIVTQGEILVISDIYPGENGNETHANINRNQPWQEEDRVFGDDWRGWDERSKTIYLPTDDLEPNRDYWIMLDNSGVGMEGNRMWWRVSVFPKEEEPENGVAIHSLKKAQAGMTVPVSVSAKGAAEVGFGLDLAADEKGDVTKYQFRGEEGADSFFTNGGWFSIYETGEHALTAYAVFPDSDELVYTDTTITICDPLRFDMTAMPGYFTEGQDNAGVTVKLPANAQRMFIQIRAECEDCWQDIYESRERDETEDTTIEIPAEYLTAGNRIRVDFQAQAEGFEDIGDGITIPVVAGTQSNLVNLRLVNNREDQTALDLGDIWANQEMVFLATPTNGNEITAIRFFNGYDWWENGEAITRDNHGDWYMNDGSVFFQERYNDDNNRAITAFAEVRVNGSETWQRTNEIRFTVQNHGMVGWYDFADGSDITVPRGTVITVEFTEAENATHYWVDAFDENNRGWDPWSWDDGTTVRINTNRLPAGVYELRGRAGGSEESGLLWRESDSSIRLIITDDIPPMPAAAFTTPAGLQRIEDEAFAGIAAKVVRIHSNVEFIGDSAFAGSQTETVIIENAYTDINFNAFAECGDLVVYGIPGGDVEQWAQRNMYTFYPIPMQ